MDAMLRRERLLIGGCLAAIAIVAWLYLLRSTTEMPGMDMSGMDMHGMVMPEFTTGDSRPSFFSS